MTRNNPLRVANDFYRSQTLLRVAIGLYRSQMAFTGRKRFYGPPAGSRQPEPHARWTLPTPLATPPFKKKPKNVFVNTILYSFLYLFFHIFLDLNLFFRKYPRNHYILAKIINFHDFVTIFGIFFIEKTKIF